MGQGHDVVLAELGDAVRSGRAGAVGRLAGHDFSPPRAGPKGHSRPGRGDPADPAGHPRPQPDPDIARADGDQGDAEVRLEGRTLARLPAQRNERDLAAAVEANRRPRDAQAATGVAGHSALTPQAARGVAASLELGDQGPAARQADLAAMGMAAKIEGVARFIGVIGNFGRMYEGDAEFAGMISQRRWRGFAVEGIDVIESGDAQALALTLQHERAIDQDLEARLAE